MRSFLSSVHSGYVQLSAGFVQVLTTSCQINFAISEWGAERIHMQIQEEKHPVQLNALKAGSKWLHQSFYVKV